MNNAIRQVQTDLRTAINPVMDPFLASTSLSQARSALGVSSSGAAVSALDLLTPAANKVPYFTSGSAAALADFTSFGRTLVASGDATTAMTALGGVNVVASSISATGGYIKLNISGTTFILQWKDASAAGNSSTVVTYPTAFSSWSRAWCNGHDGDTGSGDNKPAVSTSSTTGATVVNGSSGSISTTVLAIGV